MADALFGEPRLAAIYDAVATLTSDSTRRFWSRAEIEDSLRAAGYALAEVRDAPDRPGIRVGLHRPQGLSRRVSGRRRGGRGRRPRG